MGRKTFKCIPCIFFLYNFKTCIFYRFAVVHSLQTIYPTYYLSCHFCHSTILWENKETEMIKPLLSLWPILAKGIKTFNNSLRSWKGYRNDQFMENEKKIKNQLLKQENQRDHLIFYHHFLSLEGIRRTFNSTSLWKIKAQWAAPQE